jgi:DNA repair exonuclease SbcCD ATPase subunit
MASPGEIPNDPAAPPLDDHDLGQIKKREAALEEREKLIEEREMDSKRKNDELFKRDQEIASKEQSLDKKCQESEKRLDELKKREEAVRAAEDRVKKSKKGGQAEFLATQEEKDGLKDKTRDLQTQLEAARGEVTRLKAELEKATKKGEPTSRVSILSGSTTKAYFSIRSPEVKRPSQRLPEIKQLSQGLPERKRPGQSLPGGYDPDMLKRYEAGKKAMAISPTA